MTDERPQLHVGDHVIDREADDEQATLVVVGTPAAPADDWAVDEDSTVADYNPDYPADDTVVEVVYPERTAVKLGRHTRYSFPRSRLRRVEPVHDIAAGGDD